jgi:hypothetical protein
VGELRGSVREGTAWHVSERVARPGGIIRWQGGWYHHPFFEKHIGEKVAVAGAPDELSVAYVGLFMEEGRPSTFWIGNYPTWQKLKRVVKRADGSWRDWTWEDDERERLERHRRRSRR